MIELETYRPSKRVIVELVRAHSGQPPWDEIAHATARRRGLMRFGRLTNGGRIVLRRALVKLRKQGSRGG